MTDETPTHPLIASLERLAARDDRAGLAALRCALSADAQASAYPYVAPFLPTEASRSIEDAYLLTAGLFGLHPVSEACSLAAALRTVWRKTDRSSIEARFVALLDADREDLAMHLRHAVALARAHGLGIDWDDLLRALRSWNNESKWVQRRWAREFWAPRPTVVEGQEPTE